MTTLRLGTIGTSWITEQFIEAAVGSGRYRLEAVYSRTEDRAEMFKEKYSAEKTYTDWTAFLEDPEIDVIYIASPNSLHFTQAKQVLEHKKHAIVEKPMVTLFSEWDELISLARKQNRMVVEAIRHVYEPNFIKATELVANLSQVYGASLTYSKYSSRYDNVLNGEEPAIFSPKFAGGATNDLGIYVVYTAVQWFGKPKEVQAFTQKIRTGVDGSGTAILRYDDFDVTLHFSKISTSAHNVEVYGAGETLIFDEVTGLSKGYVMDNRTKKLDEIAFDTFWNNPLSWEADAFADVMNHFDAPESKELLNEWWTLSKDAHEVLEAIRQQTK